jgi:hypothetical protein
MNLVMYHEVENFNPTGLNQAELLEAARKLHNIARCAYRHDDLETLEVAQNLKVEIQNLLKKYN